MNKNEKCSQFFYKGYVVSKSYYDLNDKEIETLEMCIIIVQDKETLRRVARYFDVCWSTVHKRIHKKCKDLSPELYQLVCNQLYENHLRGMNW